MITMSRTSLIHRLATIALCLALPATLAAAESVAPWPAPPSACTGDCESTLTQEHDIFFVSRIAFPSGTALLGPDAKAELLHLLVELENYAVVSRVEIIGHADPSGPENYNEWLSHRRAERVADHFRQSGIDPRIITTTGHGSAEPLPGAIDPAEHRRIEIRVTVRPSL